MRSHGQCAGCGLIITYVSPSHGPLVASRIICESYSCDKELTIHPEFHRGWNLFLLPMTFQNFWSSRDPTYAASAMDDGDLKQTNQQTNKNTTKTKTTNKQNDWRRNNQVSISKHVSTVDCTVQADGNPKKS